MTPDFIKSLGVDPRAPYRYAAEVTPSDTEDLPVVTRAIHVDGWGHISVLLVGAPLANTYDPVLWGSSIATFKWLKPGDAIHVAARRVLVGGTDLSPEPAGDGTVKITALW